MEKLLSNQRISELIAIGTCILGAFTLIVRVLGLDLNQLTNEPTWFYCFTMLFIVVGLIIFVLFDKVEHKEMIKSIIVALLTAQLVYYFSIEHSLVTTFVNNISTASYVKNLIRVCAIMQSVIYLIVLINHFLINFTRQYSKRVNQNQLLLLLFIFCIIVMFATNKRISLTTILSYMFRLLLLATCVSFETRVNEYRLNSKPVSNIKKGKDQKLAVKVVKNSSSANHKSSIKKPVSKKASGLKKNIHKKSIKK